MTNNLIPGAAFFAGSESFLRDLSAEDELMITGGTRKWKGKGSDSSKSSKGKGKGKSSS